VRTTVSLDDDLAVRLERRRVEEGVPFKEILNRVLRQGLDAMEAPRVFGEVVVEPLPLGRKLLDVDNTAETLAVAEGDDFR
jgi:hypothetical protein